MPRSFSRGLRVAMSVPARIRWLMGAISMTKRELRPRWEVVRCATDMWGGGKSASRVSEITLEAQDSGEGSTEGWHGWIDPRGSRDDSRVARSPILTECVGPCLAPCAPLVAPTLATVTEMGLL